VEDRGGHLFVQGRYFFSVQEATDHFDELSAALTSMRLSGRRVRVLVDLRECPPQSAEVAGVIVQRTACMYLPSDRVAILVTSSILRLQLRRVLADQEFGVFVAEDAAREFVMGSGGMRRGRADTAVTPRMSMPPASGRAP
jgi:hypothetical protein